MARIPPAAEREELFDQGEECYCCRCMNCDFSIGTIDITVSGEFSLVEEYESLTDPGYFDHKTASATWSFSGSFTQVPYSASASPAYGEFCWNNGVYVDATTKDCTCTTTPATADLFEISDTSGGSFWCDGEVSIRTLVVAVEDPELVISDTTGNVNFHLTFVAARAAYDVGEGKWTLIVNVEGYDILGDNAGDAGVLELFCSNLADRCGHPGGTYTATFDDSYQTGIGTDTFKDWQSTITVSITVNGRGFRNCTPANVV